MSEPQPAGIGDRVHYSMTGPDGEVLVQRAGDETTIASAATVSAPDTEERDNDDVA